MMPAFLPLAFYGLDLPKTGEVPTIDFIAVDGISIKQMVIQLGKPIEQHSHGYDHATLLAAGSVRAWTGDKRPVDYHAPAMIEIPAGTEHLFLALEPNTVLYCIHNEERLLAAEAEREAIRCAALSTL